MDKKVVSYRLPHDLIEQIKQSAIADHRCINNQIIHLLTVGLKRQKQTTVKELKKADSKNAKQFKK